MAALAPALQQLPALEPLNVACNPFRNRGLAALVASPAPAPAPAGAPPPTTTGPLETLTWLNLSYTWIDEGGGVLLANALRSGALPALQMLHVEGVIVADVRVKIRLYAARPGVQASSQQPWHEIAARIPDI